MKIRGLLALAMMGLAVMAVAPAALAEEPGEKTIALINVGAVDNDTLEAVRAHLETFLMTKVRAVETQPDPTANLFDQGRKLIDLMTPEDVCFVALVAPANPIAEYSIVAPESRWALVNVNLLKPAEGAPDQFIFRLKKQAMRNIGFLFGIGYSKDPRGCNRPFVNLAELDQMGTTFDPKGFETYFEQATDLGLGRHIKRSEHWYKKHSSAPAGTNQPGATATP